MASGWPRTTARVSALHRIDVDGALGTTTTFTAATVQVSGIVPSSVPRLVGTFAGTLDFGGGLTTVWDDEVGAEAVFAAAPGLGGWVEARGKHDLFSWGGAEPQLGTRGAIAGFLTDHGTNRFLDLRGESLVEWESPASSRIAVDDATPGELVVATDSAKGMGIEGVPGGVVARLACPGLAR